MTSKEDGRRESFKQLIRCEMVGTFNSGLIAHYSTGGIVVGKSRSDYLLPD
jgi:hypothetical protein